MEAQNAENENKIKELTKELMKKSSLVEVYIIASIFVLQADIPLNDNGGSNSVLLKTNAARYKMEHHYYLAHQLFQYRLEK